MQAIETSATVNGTHDIVLDDALPLNAARRIRVIVLLPDGDSEAFNQEPDESAWLHAASTSGAFDFLNDDNEDIYTLNDGKVFDDQR